MVWDKGWYEPADEIPMDQRLARGKIDIVLHGRKLRGGFTLIKTGTRSDGRSQAKNWLLIKHRDECRLVLERRSPSAKPPRAHRSDARGDRY
jgi:bifunctional non-homologous end joining protein LigD